MMSQASPGSHTLALWLLEWEAKREPAIAVQVSPVGDLMAQPLAGLSAPPNVEAGTAVVAQLIWLLVTFIGEPLTQHLVGGVWADVPGFHLEAEGEEGV